MAQTSADLPTILEAAMETFLRFGFRKTSMDDIATAAGLSRQSLYLKFRGKEQLFEAALEHFVDRLLDLTRSHCTRDDLAVDARLAKIFAVLHGDVADGGSGRRAGAAELLELARSSHGALVARFERDFVTAVADLLTATGIARWWEEISARQLAEHLLMASSALKASGRSIAEQKKQMAVAIALVTRAMSIR